ncbi:hypothetical protein STCU_10269 [Strigomonas culicis]|uniref:RRM domain-containing protein n=1 Tax=Strigomonas culicis TaxID=28005 RepID=S9TNN2_9TRYP|nr:hypothetical protein STCU_10269 [Strigomonas culicis]|eukprot:EPY17993.1 hypothetical protein STCU_10269 [Strigomonas culicis]
MSVAADTPMPSLSMSVYRLPRCLAMADDMEEIRSHISNSGNGGHTPSESSGSAALPHRLHRAQLDDSVTVVPPTADEPSVRESNGVFFGPPRFLEDMERDLTVEDMQQRNVYISGLPPLFTNKDLRELVAPFGTIKTLKCCIDHAYNNRVLRMQAAAAAAAERQPVFTDPLTGAADAGGERGPVGLPQ